MGSVSVGCPTCNHTGYVKSNNVTETCSNCGGSGYMTLVRNSYKQICQEADSLKEGTMAYEEKNKCDGCGGTGVVDDDIYDDDNRRCEKTCDVCGGSGYED